MHWLYLHWYILKPERLYKFGTGKNRVRHFGIALSVVDSNEPLPKGPRQRVPNQMHIIDDDYIRRINAIELQ